MFYVQKTIKNGWSRGMEECGFAGAVSTDDAVAVPRRKLHIHILEKNTFPELNV